MRLKKYYRLHCIICYNTMSKISAVGTDGRLSFIGDSRSFIVE